MGGLGRYIGRCIGRYISRYSTEYRPILDRVSIDTRSSIGRYIGRVSTDVSADSLLNDAHGVGRHIDRDSVSGVSVIYRLYIVRLSVKSRSILDRVSVDISSVDILLA